MSETWPPSTPKDSEDTGAAGDRGHPHLGGPDRPRAGQARATGASTPTPGRPRPSPAGQYPTDENPAGERAGHPPGGHLAAASVRRYLAAAPAPGRLRADPVRRPRLRRLASAPGLRRPGPQPASPKKRGAWSPSWPRCSPSWPSWPAPASATSCGPRPRPARHRNPECGWCPAAAGPWAAVRRRSGRGRREASVSPFGSGSGSTGNSSTGAGAPSDISAIAAKVVSRPGRHQHQPELPGRAGGGHRHGAHLIGRRSSPTTTSSTAPPASA